MDGEKRSGFWNGVREWARIIVIALVIALPIRFFVVEPFVVNGASMDPTFSSGQFLLVDRLTYRFEPPKRGDVIVFEYPDDPSVYYIKRIVGLPGEKVSLKDGRVGIAPAGTSTAVFLDEPYVEAAHASHDTAPAVILGSTQYFVMGDNRAQSSDSRVWGPLPADLIIGRPVIRLMPLTEIAVMPGQIDETSAK
ncbi:MAG: signal peptidase I [Minisyncoccia bacterium]|jgi:signal peptidase I